VLHEHFPSHLSVRRATRTEEFNAAPRETDRFACAVWLLALRQNWNRIESKWHAIVSQGN
jgi:hypothetical protein